MAVYVNGTGSTSTTYAKSNSPLDTQYVYRALARNGDALSP